MRKDQTDAAWGDGTVSGAARLSYRGLLATPGLAPLLAAASLSRLGGRMFGPASVLFALSRFHSATIAGWVAFAGLMPGLLASPLAGALLGRIGCVAAFRLDSAATAILVGTLAGVSLVADTGVTVILALVALISLATSLGWPAVRTLLPGLAPPAAWDRANALDSATTAVIDVIGPALAGLTSGLIGPGAALIFVAICYGAALIPIARLPPRRPAETPRPSLARDAWGGIAAIARLPTLRALAGAYSLYQVSWGILVVAVPVMAERSFAAGVADIATGVGWGIVGLAGGAAALLAGHLRVMGRERAILRIGMAAAALTFGIMAIRPGAIAGTAGLLLFGIASGPIDVVLLTLRQRRTPPEVLARVIAVSMSLNLAGLPLGAALAGMTIGWSLPGTLLLAGAFASAGAAVARRIPIADRP